MRAPGIVYLWCCLAGWACSPADDGARAPALTTDLSVQGLGEALPTAAPGASERPLEGTPVDWSARLGRCVVAEGTAEGTKGGGRLDGGTWTIDVEFRDPQVDASFRALRGGSRVRVEGRVTQRSDLPVFIPKPGAPIEQGMPVPEGTDLAKASRRYVLEGTSAIPIRTVAEVEANLASHQDEDIGLVGVVWSLNGNWWFNHDGVNVHVAGQDTVPGFRDLHGKPMTLHGRLERRSLPRIDQIALKPNRDLADAFILTIRAVTSHPGWPVAECPTTR